MSFRFPCSIAGTRLLLALCILSCAPALPGVAAAQSLAQSGDNRWVVIASREDIVEAISLAGPYIGHKARVVRSANGWYAVVLGPYRAKKLTQLRSVYSGPSISSDAYLARGSDFVETIWRESDRWVIIASREDRGEAISIARVYSGHKPRVVRAQNGWYAVVLGPYATSDISSFRASFAGPTIPDDALLSRGTSFVATSWQPGDWAPDDSDVSSATADPEPEAETRGAQRAPCVAIIAGKCQPG